MALPLSVSAADSSESEVYLQAEEAVTRVSFVQVKLNTSDLKWEEGRLSGSYYIEVPFISSRNESGKINLQTDTELEEMRTCGGKLEGVGINDADSAEEREVKCEVIPDPEESDEGTLILQIDTGKRVLTFRTPYQIVQKEAALSAS